MVIVSGDADKEAVCSGAVGSKQAEKDKELLIPFSILVVL